MKVRTQRWPRSTRISLVLAFFPRFLLFPLSLLLPTPIVHTALPRVRPWYILCCLCARGSHRVPRFFSYPLRFMLLYCPANSYCPRGCPLQMHLPARATIFLQYLHSRARAAERGPAEPRPARPSIHASHSFFLHGGVVKSRSRPSPGMSPMGSPPPSASCMFQLMIGVDCDRALAWKPKLSPPPNIPLPRSPPAPVTSGLAWWRRLQAPCPALWAALWAAQ